VLHGTHFPSLPQPRRRAEHALLAVAQEAYVHGVSPPEGGRADEGARGGQRVQVGGLADLRRTRLMVEAFSHAGVDHRLPYIWVDATYHKVRVHRCVTSQRTVVAVRVSRALHGVRNPEFSFKGAFHERALLCLILASWWWR